jgi:hypothetical protein
MAPTRYDVMMDLDGIENQASPAIYRHVNNRD